MYYCKWHIYFWLVVAILVALSSCNEGEEVVNDFYFDSEAYIIKEVEVLKSTVINYNNTIVLNGESESRYNIQADSSIYKEMINLFTQTNINSPILNGEYEIDTFWIQDPSSQANIEVLNYTTNNPKLKVRWLQVYSDGSLKANIANQNFLFSYEKEVYYEKDSKFSVLTWQKTIGQDTLNIFNSLDFF